VVLVQGDWNDAFKSELDWFPGGDHDDQVDAAAHGYNHLVPTGRPRVRWL
jgi:phage terminase large subunit-like protein